MNPKITVIIPTFNYAIFINYAIESILSQNYPKELVEIIIIDDGSTDNTKEVLLNYIDEGSVKYYYQVNKGKASATYNAIQKSTGKYIFNLDADDIYLPNKIKKIVDIFEKDTSIVHVGNPASRIYGNDTNLKVYEIFPELISNKPLDGNLLLHYFLENNMLFGGGSTYAGKGDVLRKIIIPSTVDMYIDEFLIYAILPYGKSYLTSESLSVWRDHGFNYSASQNTIEKRKNKSQRILASAFGMLNYLYANNFDSKILKIYELKCEVLKTSTKETFNEKSIHDIVIFINFLFSSRLSYKILKKYHVFNRLIPNGIYNVLKAK